MNELHVGLSVARCGREEMIRFTRRAPWIAFGPSSAGITQERAKEPLREFVYLDEVSLASLLASQKGEQTENIVAQSEQEFLAEVGSKVSTGAPALPSAELNSRFQTSNSSALQTVRKANAQSLFRELHKIRDLKRIHPIEVNKKYPTIDQLFNEKPEGSIYISSDLIRGDLVEFKVKLSASYIFQISTMIAEFSEMFDESPTLFMNQVRFSDVYNAKNANKLISKLLAGLIPIDGEVSQYSVINHQDQYCIVHNDAIDLTDIISRPLKIVGVTEHLAYWKDLRRILFAENEFTMLCRISKTGLQADWNPIKVADIFREFAPDLASQIESASRNAMIQSGHAEPKTDPKESQLRLALARYKDNLISHCELTISDGDSNEIDRLIAQMKVNNDTAEGQRIAFAQTRDIVSSFVQLKISATDDLSIREKVRTALDLPLFPVDSEPSGQPQEHFRENPKPNDAHLLDVEVVAIYW
ncbi:MAG: hypothetical protein JJU18_04115 [Oceanicaulis sp.]|nr:hypothetical protein [Oceanicaulis sp.]